MDFTGSGSQWLQPDISRIKKSVQQFDRLNTIKVASLKRALI
ncbi:hypothetical protein BSU04_46630 [Caballeronia sordidicola]|uniref:Uncharacterized protein n=1 Tax=Caballeronia sordidicola TaxID=196367 RepID=A0A226WJU7_CABSO|nr:hypothetical protein BSU04_46630 [Caballeronia sordidicola]